MTAAVNGMTTLRKAIISEASQTTMTTARNSGSFELRTVAKSWNTAVWPPTYACMRGAVLGCWG